MMKAAWIFSIILAVHCQAQELTATDYQREAVKRFPALAIAGSPMNAEYVKRANALKEAASPVLQKPTWPLDLAIEVATALEPPAPVQPVGSAPPSTLAIEVKSVAASSTIGNSFKDGAGGYDNAYARERKIEINLHAIGQEPLNAHVDVWWTGKAIAGKKRELLRKNSSEHTIDPKKPAIWIESSGVVKGKDLNLPLIGYRSTSGSKIEGWVVHVSSPGGDKWIASDEFLIDFVRPK